MSIENEELSARFISTSLFLRSYGSPLRQHGAFLFEILIGILVVVIMGAGLMHVVATVLHTQRYTTNQQLAVIQLREFLQTVDSSKNKVVIGNKKFPQSILPISTTPGTIVSVTIGVTGFADTQRIVYRSFSRQLVITHDGLLGGQVLLVY